MKDNEFYTEAVEVIKKQKSFDDCLEYSLKMHYVWRAYLVYILINDMHLYMNLSDDLKTVDERINKMVAFYIEHNIVDDAIGAVIINFLHTGNCPSVIYKNYAKYYDMYYHWICVNLSESERNRILLRLL